MRRLAAIILSAAVFAAGMACQGFKPVAAIYSTFMFLIIS